MMSQEGLTCAVTSVGMERDGRSAQASVSLVLQVSVEFCSSCEASCMVSPSAFSPSSTDFTLSATLWCAVCTAPTVLQQQRP